ncbi:citrate transporter [Halopseudomonas laoshanensis]|uniref:Citrate transporter n=1 Tax=Halopseudomonas laoshanensis TaxID=2268758 RepID=A0A7V7GQJ5_9GAMM|nr:SLC13 family permease [Halopseudomonas laoshanensis]KAA0692419.1 citrate transporter [Halopseudomonas laoshanensis]
MTWLILIAFVVTYLGMAVGGIRGLRVDRAWIAVAAATVLLLSGAMSPAQAMGYLDGGALLLLFALMLVSAQFDFSGAYTRLTELLDRHAQKPELLLLGVVAMGGLLSAILVNDIVAFALTPLLCRTLRQRGLDPRPFLLALALACNAGSVATLIGNPQNILIGQAGGLDFWSYTLVAAVPALMALTVVYAVIWWQWRHGWTYLPRSQNAVSEAMPHQSYRYKPMLATLALILLFSLPFPREYSALAIAVLVMLSRTVDSHRYVEKVDWNLLLLFIGLFLVTGAAAAIPQVTQFAHSLTVGGELPESVAALAGLSLIASNLIGNVPFVILLLGLWPDLSDASLIGLAVMSTLAGNFLLIGSVVNLIVVESARRQGVRLGFIDFARSGVPVTLISMLLAGIWLTIAAGG